MDKTCSSVAMGFEMSRKPNQGKGRFIQIELLGYTLNYVYICDGLNMLGPGNGTPREVWPCWRECVTGRGKL